VSAFTGRIAALSLAIASSLIAFSLSTPATHPGAIPSRCGSAVGQPFCWADGRLGRAEADENLSPAGCVEVLEPQLAMLQGSGQFGTAFDVPPTADAQTRLLAALGRRP